MKHCWYCGRPLEHGYDWVVTTRGKLRPVCHDDRMCKPHTGICGRGSKPVIKKRPRNKTLQRVKRKEWMKHE